MPVIVNVIGDDLESARLPLASPIGHQWVGAGTGEPSPWTVADVIWLERGPRLVDVDESPIWYVPDGTVKLPELVLD